MALSHSLPDSAERAAYASAAAAAFRTLDDPLALASSLHSEAEARRSIGEYSAASLVQTEAVALYRPTTDQSHLNRYFQALRPGRR